MAPALRVRVEGRMVAGPDGTDIATARAVPGDEAPHISVADVLAPAVDEEQKSAQDEAKNWLRTLLADGKPMAAKDVADKAEDDKIATRTLNRAKKALGVESKREGGAGSEGRWTWSLGTLPRPGGNVSGGNVSATAQPVETAKVETREPGPAPLTLPASETGSLSTLDPLGCPDCGASTEGGVRCATCHYARTES
jgi:hypothetical protein